MKLPFRSCPGSIVRATAMLHSGLNSKIETKYELRRDQRNERRKRDLLIRPQPAVSFLDILHQYSRNVEWSAWIIWVNGLYVIERPLK